MTDNIEVFTHSSIRITDGNKHIYIDPFCIKEDFHNADFILLTHDHYDHFSPDDIKKAASENTVLIVPEKMRKKAMEVEYLVKEIETVSTNDKREIQSLYLETLPAYNILKPFHPKHAGWVGYILQIAGKRIYIAGDTDATPEAKNVHCDIALVPIGGTYTMNAKKAADLINIIQPQVAIPTHYGNIVGKESDSEVFKTNVKPPVTVEIKIKFT